MLSEKSCDLCRPPSRRAEPNDICQPSHHFRKSATDDSVIPESDLERHQISRIRALPALKSALFVKRTIGFFSVADNGIGFDSQIRRADLWLVQEAAWERCARNRNGPGHLQADCRTASRTYLGRILSRRRLNLQIYVVCVKGIFGTLIRCLRSMILILAPIVPNSFGWLWKSLRIRPTSTSTMGNSAYSGWIDLCIHPCITPVTTASSPERWLKITILWMCWSWCRSPVLPGCLIEVRPVGILNMVDSEEGDQKVLAVPTRNPRYDQIHTMDQIFTTCVARSSTSSRFIKS